MEPIRLRTPLDDKTVRSLNVGDVVALDGLIYTGRDAMHHRIHAGTPPPVDLAGQVLYHCGPVMVREGERWVCRAAGPTTSSREEPYEWKLIRDSGLRGVIGKGGMGDRTLAACQEYGAVYFHAVGGAAQVLAQAIRSVDGVDWLDLGSPEAVWHLRVEGFPAIVTMDAHGNSLHRAVREESSRRFLEMRV